MSITTQAITSVAKALQDAVNSATNSGSALQSFVTAAVKAKLPKVLEEDAVKSIADAYAVGQRWEHDDKQSKVRKSEARNLIRMHALLAEGITALRASEHGVCSYHDAVKLCRLMKSEGSVGAAVLAFNTKTPSKPVDQDAKFTTAIQSYYQHVSGSKDKRKSAKLAALRELCDKLGIEAVKGTIQGESA